ncbi:type II toxin-antitoxin system RelE/ParE family toxin [Neorhizobium galegae]|nr:type II toxin-antitoxin system RelE/ParE family toxin [Neorhizobium galegae]
MKLVWSAFALSDHDDIFTHIEADNPNAEGTNCLVQGRP